MKLATVVVGRVDRARLRMGGVAAPVLVLMGGMLFSQGVACGQVLFGNPVAGPSLGGDDLNTSTLNPSPPILVDTLPNSQCPWINTGLTAFDNAHPNYTYTWATQAQMQKVEQGLSYVRNNGTSNNTTVTDGYNAWVVSEPTIMDADGGTLAKDPRLTVNNNMNEVGGAVMNLRYTPVAGAPAIPNLHWVQGIQQTLYGGAQQTLLDNNASASPFYDDSFDAGTLAGGGGFFADSPFQLESDVNGEYEQNPVATVQFQVVLANDTVTGNNHAITLYGGLWWGYQYTATDMIPEPASIGLLSVVGIGLLGRRARKTASAEKH